MCIRDRPSPIVSNGAIGKAVHAHKAVYVLPQGVIAGMKDMRPIGMHIYACLLYTSPVMVGAAGKTVPAGWYRDDAGENISCLLYTSRCV